MFEAYLKGCLGFIMPITLGALHSHQQQEMRGLGPFISAHVCDSLGSQWRHTPFDRLRGDDMLNQLTASIEFQAQALQLRSERQRLIASNIANADTPGYQAKDFDFAKALQQATGQSSGAANSLATAHVRPMSTHAGHMNLHGQSAGNSTSPELQYATPSMTNLDNNTVDMDRERASFADNTVKYEATLRFINGSVRTLTTAITGQ
jgi:flagellar basal-body rod protein FlgB